MICCAYERKDSPWIWIEYRISPDAKRKYKKTKIRKDDPDRGRKVKIALNEAEHIMLTEEPEPVALFAAPIPSRKETWAWVRGFLKTRYGEGRTLAVYLAQWRSLSKFLVEAEVTSPALLTREHCADLYVPWRTSEERKKEKSKRRTGVNTAINELKLLGMLMDEAIERGLADDNPARKLKLKRTEPAPKPEITDPEAAIIFAALETRPLWMQRSFFLALQTGLRFASTRIERQQVRWEDGLIIIEKPKGGRKREFSIPIYPEIEPLIRAWWKTGEPSLWDMPENERSLSGLYWTKFFRAIGLPHLCFHCTRVTFITRGARAGIPESAMMAMVNHASKEIHRIYQRFRGADVLKYRERMTLPASPGQSSAGAMP